jgi:hypothetical protein
LKHLTEFNGIWQGCYTTGYCNKDVIPQDTIPRMQFSVI